MYMYYPCQARFLNQEKASHSFKSDLRPIIDDIICRPGGTKAQ